VNEEFLLILLASVFIRVYLPERFRTVSPAISAALRLWFIFLFRLKYREFWSIIHDRFYMMKFKNLILFFRLFSKICG
jgi:hypothetical protein